MRQLIAGNWKMNGVFADVARFAGPLRAATGLGCDVLVCPPATLLAAMAQALAGSAIAVGAQDCHPDPPGAHTGDLAAAMLRDAGASHVILGHSERRAAHGETDAVVCAKVLAAHAAGLVPIVCVGESEAERLAGRAEAVVAGQLAGSLPGGFAGVIAYEPVWAIGSGRTAAQADVAAMHAVIGARLHAQFGAAAEAMPVLYGGSVKPENAASLLTLPGVHGALVGGASLKPADFLAIARAARTLPNPAGGG